jgi:armadillo repeat-containing protein 5
MLDQTAVLRLLDNITKTSDKRIIYKNLVQIRQSVVTNDFGINLFYRQNGIKILVDLVTKPHEQILEVALSILGNCCTKKECCLQVSFFSRTMHGYE